MYSSVRVGWRKIHVRFITPKILMKKDIARSGSIVFISIPTMIVTFIAHVWSLILLIGATQSPSLILVALFVFWVSSPFVGLSLLFLLGRRWPPVARIVLYFVGILCAAGSLLIYERIIQPPAGSPNAFIWLVTPAASWLLIIVAFSIAWLISGRTPPAKTDT